MKGKILLFCLLILFSLFCFVSASNSALNLKVGDIVHFTAEARAEFGLNGFAKIQRIERIDVCNPETKICASPVLVVEQDENELLVNSDWVE